MADENLTIEEALKQAYEYEWDLATVEDKISTAYDMLDDPTSDTGDFLENGMYETGPLDDLIYPIVDEYWNGE